MIAAGGTGGHLFPAVAVAEQLQILTDGNCDFHFIGTKDRIEARVVPELGHTLHAISLGGITKSIKTLAVPLQVIGAVLKCRKIINDQDISAVLAAGAYLSYPPGIAAAMERIPLVLMESNVNPGKSIRMLSKRATRIITAFDESKGYFPPSISSKIRCYGNPVRGNILSLPSMEVAKARLTLPETKKIVFIFGGSLGARSINRAVVKNLGEFAKSDYFFIWQTGKNFDPPADIPSNVRCMQFVEDMAGYYAASDLIVARSGATTVAELCIAGKASVLVPLSSASNNEQAHNAKILQNNNASITVLDIQIENEMLHLIRNLAADPERLELMGKNAKALAKPNAAFDTAKEILSIIKY